MKLKEIFFIFFIQFTKLSLFKNENSEYQNEFETWFMKYKRVYQTNTERDFRFAIYMKNLKLINLHNQQELSYQLELNDFADLTNEEFNRFYSNPYINNKDLNNISLDYLEDINLQDLEQEINWSQKYNQGSVKNQMHCGSCYIFSAVGLVELDYAIRNDTNVIRFSEQQLLDCGYQMGLNDCNGGSPQLAAQYLNKFGAIKENINPYQARKNQCRNYPSFYKPRDVYQAKGSIKNLIKLLNREPVVVSMEITTSLKYYKLGIYDSKAPCGFFDDHGMLAVGYNLKEQYIILRNSWGPVWGTNGQMKWFFGKDMNDIGPFPNLITLFLFVAFIFLFSIKFIIIMNALIYGGTGATGTLFLQEMKKSQEWNLIFIVTRKINEMLKNLQEDKRFQVLEQPDILNTQETLQSIMQQKVDIDGVYNFLGSQVKHGKELFVKIDKTYVLQSCDFAKELKARHFLHITSQASNKNSMFLYMKTKGEVEEELQKKDLPNLTVLRPGLIKNRPNERFAEKMAKYVPFLDKIDAVELAKYAHELTLKTLKENKQEGYKSFNNKKIEKKIYEQFYYKKINKK